ncbi:MAG: hypothetical protein WCY70_06290 [Methanoculleus sp.]
MENEGAYGREGGRGKEKGEGRGGKGRGKEKGEEKKKFLDLIFRLILLICFLDVLL